MSGAGPSVTSAFANNAPPPPQLLSALSEIATKCADRRIRLIVDAESQHIQPGIAHTTLSLMRQFNHGADAVIYNTYQAYLKSTPAVLAHHIDAAEKEGFTLGLKLVRGAYMHSDDRALIHARKQDTDDAYNALAQGALCRRIGEFGAPDADARRFPAVNLLLASHNKDSVLAAHRLHAQRVEAGLPTVPVCYAQLHGMADAVSFSLLREEGAEGEKPGVFKCSTWGSVGECVGYLLRRAVENRDAVLRTGEEVRAVRREVGRRLGLWGFRGRR